MRKRSKHRPRPVPSVPIHFGFPRAVKTAAMMEARLAADAVIAGRHDPLDVGVLVRIAEYCVRIGESLMLRGELERDGLEAAVDAVRTAAPVLLELSKRSDAHILTPMTDVGRSAIDGLVEAYEALFNEATRRDSVAALSRSAA